MAYEEDWPLVRRGNTDDDDAFGAVTIIHHLLNAHGADLEVFWVYGQRTETAVRDF